MCLVSKFFTARALSRAKTGFPAHSVVQTGYTIPSLWFSDTLNCLVGVV